MDTLPPEILVQLFALLDPTGHIPLVCRHWAEVYASPTLWQRYCERLLPDVYRLVLKTNEIVDFRPFLQSVCMVENLSSTSERLVPVEDVFRFEKDSMSSVATTVMADRVVSSCISCEVSVWQTPGPPHATVEGSDSVWHLVLMSEQVCLAGADDGTISVIDLNTMDGGPQRVRVVPAHDSRISVLVKADHENVDCYSASAHGEVCGWKLSPEWDLECALRFQDTTCVFSLCALPNGVLVSGSAKTARVWTNGVLTATYQGEHTDRIAHILPYSSTQVLSASYDLSMRVWDTSDVAQTRVFAGGDASHRDIITCVVFARCRGLSLAISSSNDRTVKLWNAETGELLQSLTDHNGQVRRLALSKGGRIVASSGWDDRVFLYRLEEKFGRVILSKIKFATKTGALPGRGYAVNDMHFDSKGRLVAACTDGMCRVWWLCGQKQKKFFGEAVDK